MSEEGMDPPASLDEVHGLRAEVARLERQLAEQRATNRRAWRAASRFHAIADLVIEVPRLFRGPLGTWDFPQAFLAQVALRLTVERSGLYERTAEGLRPLALIGNLPALEWTGPVPELAAPEAEARAGEGGEAFNRLLDAAVGTGWLWGFDPETQTGLLMTDGPESFSGEDLVAARSVLRLYADTRRRLAAESAQQRGLARARALNRLAYSFIHVEADHFESTFASALREVVEQLGAERGCIYRLDPAAGTVRRAGPPQGPDLAPGLLPAEVHQADVVDLLDRLRLQEVVEIRRTETAALTALPLLALTREELGHHRALFVPIAFRQGLEGFFALVLPLEALDVPGRPDPLRDDPFLRTTASIFASALAAQRDRQERQAMQTQIQQAQKLDSLGVLAGGIAHDFNNILTPLFAGIELALLLSRDRPAVTSPLQGALTACERARKLVQQILLFSRKNAAERRPVELGRLLREAAGLLQASLPSTIQLEVHVPSDPLGRPITTLGDSSQLVQVLVNLGTNAWHAIGSANGRVRLGAALVEIDDDTSHQTLRPGTYAHISVSDTGPGIPVNIQPHIFDPFFTTKPAGKGTGMGLAVVHGIVTDHGGVVSFRTGPGGTTFHIHLPLSGTAADSTEVGLPHAQYEGSEGVLVVDDEPEIGWRIQQLLVRLGYRAVAVSRPADALSALMDAPGDFRLMITDFTMPEMTGLELARAAIELAPDLRILLCTGYHEPLTAEVLQRAHIAGTVHKPFRYTTLARHVRQVLDQPPNQ